MRSLVVSPLVCWPVFDGAQDGLGNCMLRPSVVLGLCVAILVQRLHMPAYQLGTPVLNYLFKQKVNLNCLEPLTF